METDVPNINEVDTHSLAAMTDHLGSITAMADNSDWCYDAGYDMWGKRSAQYVFCDDFGFDRGFTGHEHIDALGLIDMNGRMYDPLQGRFLSPDNYIQAPDNPQNYNRYSYCLNNPLKYTDPDGESWLIAGVVALMLLTEEGYNIQKAISPVALHFDVHLGTHQLGLGYDVSIGFPTSSPISYRNHYGETYYWKTYGGNSGWEYREGGEWGLQGLPYGIPYYINFSGTEFSGINSQTTNSVSFSKLPFMRTTYENDTELFVKLPGVPEYDNNDRYRTAAVSIKRGPFTLQTNLHTGMAGKKGENIDGDGTEENPFHFIGGDIDKQHHGILSLGIGPFRFGWDSEGIRHTLQNRLAHDWMWYYNYGYMYPWVQDNEREDSFFFYLGSGTGNTMW
jgi:RHS repeat-associated protein